MQVRALRGVCLGTDRHLVPGDPPAEVDNATAQFLVAIGAVEPVTDTPAPPADQIESTTATPAKAGKKEKQHAE